MKLLITEKTGDKLSNVTNYMNPNPPKFCRRDGCFLCETNAKPTYGNCWLEGVTYQIDCMLCLKDGRKAFYLGETGYSCYFRGCFHQDGLRNQNPENPLHKHNLECHPGGRLSWRDFIMTLRGCFNRPLLRQSQEGQLIGQAVHHKAGGENLILLNSKSEFFQPGVVKESYKRLLD